MNLTRTLLRQALLAALLSGIVMTISACQTPPVPTTGQAAATLPETGSLAFPAVAWAQTTPCDGQHACDKLFITQEGQISQLNASAQGFQAQALPKDDAQPKRWVIDTGSPSPDGKWIAFTSISNESGGPIFLQNLETGQWTNLIEAVNTAQPDAGHALQEDWIWDVIGWFPDSQRLLVGPADLGRVDVIDTVTYEHQVIPINSDGMGGSTIVSLAPDGSGFVYLGSNPDGASQVLSRYTFASGETTQLITLAYKEGVLQFPRYAPDGASIAYLLQQGHPSSGLTYAIDLYSVNAKTSESLVQGNLGLTIPTWSPDGQTIAFTRLDNAEPLLAVEGAAPKPIRSNVWVVSVADKKATQVTFIDGQARSPVWSGDGKLLAFVTHDGQVGLAEPDQPGKIWQAAGTSSAYPELTSVFFLP